MKMLKQQYWEFIKIMQIMVEKNAHLKKCCRTSMLLIAILIFFKMILLTIFYIISYYCYGLKEKVKKIIKKCDFCQRTKKKYMLTDNLHPITSSEPLNHIQVDFSFFESNSECLLHIIDLHSKKGLCWIFFRNWTNFFLNFFLVWGSYHKTKEAIHTVNLLSIVSRSSDIYSVIKLQLDNGREFKNKEVDDFCANRNIERCYGLPYSPSTQVWG